MSNDAEKIVSKFYNTHGWETRDGVSEDMRAFEDLREHARKYVSKTYLRVMRHIPERGENMLDMASGPIETKEYVAYSKNFKKRYCIDLSAKALESAKRNIGDHGVFLHGSFFDIPLEDNFFDCTISLHTIYHMDKDRQEEAVRKLIKVTKPERPLIVAYRNPTTLFGWLRSSFPIRLIRKAAGLLKKPVPAIEDEYGARLYFHAHPIEWWDRFRDVASVEIFPARSFTSTTQKKLIPNNKIGGVMLDVLFSLEDRFPSFFAKNFEYPIIVITKKS